MDQTYRTSPSVRKLKTLPQYFKHLKNAILHNEAEDSSLNRSNRSRTLFLNSSSVSSTIHIEEAEDSYPMDPSTSKQSPMRKQKILPKSIPYKEAEDSSPVSPYTKKFPTWKQKILPQSPQRTMKEVEDSSLLDHTSILLLSESIHTTP
nr:hypothetical protein CFP56_27345 [Quercus suber]